MTLVIPGWVISTFFFAFAVGVTVSLIVWLALDDDGEEDED